MFKIQKMDFLISLYIFCIAVVELMGTKTFPITQIGSWKLNASVAIFLIPILFSITDIIIEVHGKERARSLVRSGLVMVFFIMLYSLLATALPPTARFAPSEAAYDSVFFKTVRIAIASLIAFGVSEFTDMYIFSKIRERMKSKALWFRNNASNFVSQFLDTILFISLAFYATNKGFGDNASFLWSLILPYWLLKCAMSILETPLVYAGVKWLKDESPKHEIRNSK